MKLPLAVRIAKASRYCQVRTVGILLEAGFKYIRRLSQSGVVCGDQRGLFRRHPLRRVKRNRVVSISRGAACR